MHPTPPILMGHRLIYQWQIIAKPKNSHTKLDDRQKITPQLWIDKPGVYQIQLLVADGIDETSSSMVEINTEETRPIIAEIHNQKLGFV